MEIEIFYNIEHSSDSFFTFFLQSIFEIVFLLEI